MPNFIARLLVCSIMALGISFAVSDDPIGQIPPPVRVSVSDDPIGQIPPPVAYVPSPDCFPCAR